MALSALLTSTSAQHLPAWWPGSNTCLLHVVTGLWCPLCGGTRATRALLDGSLTEALGCNPFALMLECVLVAALLRYAAARAQGRTRMLLTGREGIALGVTAVVFFAARNTPWLQPWLARLLGPPGYGA